MEREAVSLWKKAARATRNDFKHMFASPAQAYETPPKAVKKVQPEEVLIVKEELQPEAIRLMCKAVNSHSIFTPSHSALKDARAV